VTAASGAAAEEATMVCRGSVNTKREMIRIRKHRFMPRLILSEPGRARSSLYQASSSVARS